jgi:hypothetical protein
MQTNEGNEMAEKELLTITTLRIKGTVRKTKGRATDRPEPGNQAPREKLWDRINRGPVRSKKPSPGADQEIVEETAQDQVECKG